MILASLLMAVTTDVSTSCFWSYPRDLPLVETNARYWRADFALAPGERLEILGQFPHARQMSFNLHRRSDNAALAAVHDEALLPLRGSVNPFRPGGNRTAGSRAFRLTVDSRARRGRPGLLPAAAGASEPGGYRLLYRIYLPDARHPGGGVPLPSVSRIDAQGRRHDLGGACPDPASVDSAQPLGPTRLPAAPGAVTDPLDWRGSATPPGSGSGDLLVNRDNAYAYAMTDMRRGEVLVLRGRAPTAPRTWRGDRRMGTGQVRYWSLCTYRHPSDRAASCLADELIPVDRQGRYTIIVSPAGRRPHNARPECGMAWLDAMTESTGLVLLRHVRPHPTFRFSPLHVQAGQNAGAALADYEPIGTYASRASIEARGCER